MGDSGGKEKRLRNTVEKMLGRGRGLLAADERPESLGKKFGRSGIENSAENRRRFRELLVAAQGIEAFVGGVILNEETLDQRGDGGESLTRSLITKNIAVGVKLDRGLADLHPRDEAAACGAFREQISTGLEDLGTRLDGAVARGAEFAKWRSVFSIARGSPSETCVAENVAVLCRFAVAAQALGVVPVVEPEIALEGCYSLAEMRAVAERVYSRLVAELRRCGAYLPGTVLKISFLAAGRESSECVTADEVGRQNVALLEAVLPLEIGGAVFLSGGHPSGEAIGYLAAVKRQPCALRHISFSFARAITDGVLALWAGEDQNRGDAQKELLRVLGECGRANGSGV